jgi:hypothetical protein
MLVKIVDNYNISQILLIQEIAREAIRSTIRLRKYFILYATTDRVFV